MSRRYRNTRNQPEKSRVFAAILAFVFGGFGAHKFYLRDPGAGIFYIFLFFITSRLFPVSFLLGWIDALRLLTMNDEAFDRKYNKHLVDDPDRYVEPRRPSRRTRRVEVKRPTERRARARAIERANPFKKSGIKKYREFDLEGAIADFNQGLEINPNDIALHFNLACAYSLTEKKEKSFHHLDRAVELGYTDFEKIRTHDDLAFIRIQPEFDAFRENNFRLKSQGTPVNVDDSTENAVPANEEIKDDVLLSQLNKLAELRKKGYLTEDEFQMERKKLLRR